MPKESNFKGSVSSWPYINQARTPTLKGQSPELFGPEAYWSSWKAPSPNAENNLNMIKERIKALKEQIEQIEAMIKDFEMMKED